MSNDEDYLRDYGGLVVVIIVAGILIYIYFEQIVFYGSIAIGIAIGIYIIYQIIKWNLRNNAKFKEAERQRVEAERQFVETEKIRVEKERYRDADEQQTPYEYQIGRHAQEALAIRYGIAHNGNKILLRKVNKIKNEAAKYYVELTRNGARLAIAVIEPGTEFVKTFYPLDKDWFNQYEDLELTLKHNGSFSLEKLAEFNVNAILS